MAEVPAWRPDAVLPGFELLDLPIGMPPEEGEPADEPLVGTLIRRDDPARRQSRRAVLYVHGWNDYFFQEHVAASLEQAGYAFYAVDLRRYGRSLRAGQFHGYVADLGDYAEELDEAAAVLQADHDDLVVMAHSTGGLTAALWLADRPGLAAALVLNSPWLDMQGPPGSAAVLKPILEQWGRRRATSVIPVPELSKAVAVLATHADFHGEWSYDLELKSEQPRPIRVGWMRAVIRGHRRLARGLGLSCPALVVTSAQSAVLWRYGDRAHTTDVVLDVDRIMAAATRLGDYVTLVRLMGGMHDLSLSAGPVREEYLGLVNRWLGQQLGLIDALPKP